MFGRRRVKGDARDQRGAELVVRSWVNVEAIADELLPPAALDTISSAALAGLLPP